LAISYLLQDGQEKQQQANTGQGREDLTPG
jgi:hypothetical protein